MDILNVYSKSSGGFSLPPFMLWGKHSPNTTISHVRKRPWHRATSEYREHNQPFLSRFKKTYFLLLFAREMILSFGKHCRRGFICNTLWHILLQYLCHFLCIWEKIWQYHVHISESSPCNIPGAGAVRIQLNRLKEAFMDAESRKDLTMVLLWLTICFATSLSIW